MHLRVSIVFALGLIVSVATAQAFHAGLTDLTIHPTEARNWRGSQQTFLHCLLWYPTDVTAPQVEQSFTVAGFSPLFRAGLAGKDMPLAASAGKLPLVVLSHGLGGTADQFGWLAPELARHGYMVLAVDHPGNNALEPYTPEGLLLWWERALDISDALDGVLADQSYGPHVDAGRIGALGYSIGGETVLALAGARVDQPAFLEFCMTHSHEQTCRVPTLGSVPGDASALLAAVRASSPASLARSGESFRDARIRSVFAIAPAPGQAFHASSFEYVTVPITLVAGTADTLAPPNINAEQFAAWIPQARIALLPGVSHYTFLDLCTPEGIQVLQQYCTETSGVDRNAVHRKVTGMALAFFERTLAAAH